MQNHITRKMQVVDGDCMNRDVPGSGGMEIGTSSGPNQGKGRNEEESRMRRMEKNGVRRQPEKQGEDERSCSCQPCGVLFVQNYSQHYLQHYSEQLQLTITVRSTGLVQFSVSVSGGLNHAEQRKIECNVQSRRRVEEERLAESGRVDTRNTVYYTIIHSNTIKYTGSGQAQTRPGE